MLLQRNNKVKWHLFTCPSHFWCLLFCLFSVSKVDLHTKISLVGGRQSGSLLFHIMTLYIQPQFSQHSRVHWLFVMSTVAHEAGLVHPVEDGSEISSTSVVCKLESLRIDRDDFFIRGLTQVNKMKPDLWMWSNKMKFYGWNILWWMNVSHKMIFHGWNSIWWMNVTRKMIFHGWNSLWWMNVTCKMIFHWWNSLWWMNVMCKMKTESLRVDGVCSCDVSCAFKFGICWPCLAKLGSCVENHYRV